MANVPSIPPLLCSTPPPINFGEEDDDSALPPTLNLDDDDDEFGYFNVPVDDLHQNNANIEVPSPPFTPLPYDSAQGVSSSISDSVIFSTPPPLESPTLEQVKHTSPVTPVEAFNLGIAARLSGWHDLHNLPMEAETWSASPTADDENKWDTTAKQSDDEATNLAEKSPPTLPSNTTVEVLITRSERNGDLVNDNTKPSIVNETKDEVADNTIKMHEDILIEDVEDDSSDDEHHSPKKLASHIVSEDSDDFFAIYILDTVDNNVASPEKVITAAKEEATEEAKEFEAEPSVETLGLHSEENEDFATFEAFEAAPASEELEVTHDKMLSDDDEFSQFSKVSFDISKASNVDKSDKEVATGDAAISQTDDFDDDFDDFQDFSAAPTIEDSQQIKADLETPPAEDDEDFGDFAESAALPGSAPQIPTVNTNNLSQRLKPVLEMMFPAPKSLSEAEIVATKQLPRGKLQLKSVDSATALDYQWIKSDMRHSLIKSLGIDSRNILFGEKWNSSMPRYAVNLSFSPLQPLKPQSTESTHSNTNAKDAQNSSEDTANATKAAVPAVEFDWNSSGLVNPLDGAKEDANAGEAKAIHTTESGNLNTPDQPPQPSSADAQHVEDAQHGGDDATATTPAVLGAATAGALPADVPADCFGHSFIYDGLDIDLGLEASHNGNSSLASLGAPPATISSASIGFMDEGSSTEEKQDDSSSNSNSLHLEHEVEDEVVTTSTYAGPLKETHIYTPSRSEAGTVKTTRAGSTTVAKIEPIDFDYEIAAAGIIIDETVVKKEYRDVEYNPCFDFGKDYKANGLTKEGAPAVALAPTSLTVAGETPENDFEDEFTEFQSVAPPKESSPSKAQTGEMLNRAGLPRGLGGAEMILSPAILLPQAISMEQNKPKIEWGDSAANINPEELARIEELFPQPKSNRAKEQKPNTPRSSPIRNGQTLSISASVAHKEQQAENDDDDWSDFVSVPAAVSNVTPAVAPQLQRNNNNILPPPSLSLSPRRQPHPTTTPRRQQPTPEVANEDEWSDFVSSTPVPSPAPPALKRPQYCDMPQFNSAAWQNANFYNNPLSLYQQNYGNGVQKSMNAKFQNNNNNYNHNSINQYLSLQHNLNYQSKQPQPQQQQPMAPQQVHIMQDFSTAAPYRSQPGLNHSNHFNNQFQVGSAKVAPSISLIPDLGFVAPALPARTAFVNSIPKPSFSTKK